MKPTWTILQERLEQQAIAIAGTYGQKRAHCKACTNGGNRRSPMTRAATLEQMATTLLNHIDTDSHAEQLHTYRLVNRIVSMIASRPEA